MEKKKPVKKPKKKVLQTKGSLQQKQKQKQSVKVVVNVGGKDGKIQPQIVRNPNPELVMYAPPPNIFTKGNIPVKKELRETPLGFRDQEPNDPVYNMPSTTRPSQMPFMNEPVRQPRMFVEETSTVEFLPDNPVRQPYEPYQVQEPIGLEVPNTEQEIVNDFLDNPYQINAGIIDDFNERTGRTEYIQTQAPTYDMTIYNPMPDNQIEDTYSQYPQIEYTYPQREEMIMGNEDYQSKELVNEELKLVDDELAIKEEELIDARTKQLNEEIPTLKEEELQLIVREKELMKELSSFKAPEPSNKIEFLPQETSHSLLDIYKSPILQLERTTTNPLFTALEPQPTDNKMRPPLLYQETKSNLRPVEEVRAYKPTPIDENFIDKLPFKRGGGLALSTKNMKELNDIADILGVKTTTGSGKSKMKASLVADINFDMEQRKKLNIY